MNTLDEIIAAKRHLPDPGSVDDDTWKVSISPPIPQIQDLESMSESIMFTTIIFTKTQIRQGLETIDVWQFIGPIIINSKEEIEKIKKQNIKDKWIKNWSHV